MAELLFEKAVAKLL